MEDNINDDKAKLNNSNKDKNNNINPTNNINREIQDIIENINKNVIKDYQLEIVYEINYMLAKENNKFGVIDKAGNKVIDTLYDEIQIPNPSKPVFINRRGSFILFIRNKSRYRYKSL